MLEFWTAMAEITADDECHWRPIGVKWKSGCGYYYASLSPIDMHFSFCPYCSRRLYAGEDIDGENREKADNLPVSLPL